MPSTTKCAFGTQSSIGQVLLNKVSKEVPEAEDLAKCFYDEAQRLARLEETEEAAGDYHQVAPRLTCYAIQGNAYATKHPANRTPDTPPCIYTHSTQHVEVVFQFITQQLKDAIARVPQMAGLGQGLDIGWSGYQVLNMTEPKDAAWLWNAVQVARTIVDFDDGSGDEGEDNEPYASNKRGRAFCLHLAKLNTGMEVSEAEGQKLFDNSSEVGY